MEQNKEINNTSKYDFNEIIQRKNTNSLKYDFGMQRKNRDDLLPLWVADMDFKLPQEVIDDLAKCVQHGIFGYTDPRDGYYQALQQWFLTHHGWEIKKEWNTVTPGVVYAICTAIRAFTNPGDAVMIQQPVYYPFKESIEDNGRECINNQLVYENGSYHMDLNDFEEKIIHHQVKLFLLCSPHNPVGRVWTKEELMAVGEICLKHNVIVVSDEIHCDFTYPGYTHTCFATLSEEFAQNAIICTAPSKTFNIAGLQISNIIISNKQLRLRFKKANAAAGYSQGTTFGIAACQSVYEKGNEWYEELKVYLKGNLDFVREYLAQNIPQITLVEPEGTYLIWLDCSGLGLTAPEIEKLVTEKAKLWLDGGRIFGEETALFQRINIACPRSVLKQALHQLECAINLIK